MKTLKSMERKHQLACVGSGSSPVRVGKTFELH